MYCAAIFDMNDGPMSIRNQLRGKGNQFQFKRANRGDSHANQTLIDSFAFPTCLWFPEDHD